MKSINQPLQALLTITILLTFQAHSFSQNVDVKEYSHPLELFSETTDKKPLKYIESVLKYENLENEVKYSKWIDDENSKDKKLLKSLEVDNTFVAYMKFSEGVVNRMKYYEKNKDLIDDFDKIIVTYGSQIDFLEQHSKLTSKDQKKSVEFLAFSMRTNILVMSFIFKHIRAKKKMIGDGYADLALAERLSPILKSQIYHLSQLKGKDHWRFYLRNYKVEERCNTKYWRDYFEMRDETWKEEQEQAQLNKEAQIIRQKELEENEAKEAKERKIKEEAEANYRKKFEVGSVEHIGPKVSSDWFNFIKNSGLDVDAAVVGVDGPLKYYIRGYVKNISQEVLSFDIRTEGNIYKIRETTLLGLTREKRELAFELDSKLSVYQLQPKEKRPFLIEIDPKINTLATGLNIGIGTGTSTFKLTDYNLIYTEIDVLSITKEKVMDELEKQNKWIRNYLFEEESETNELNYFGKKIRKYDSKRYNRATMELHNEIFNFMPCLTDVDQYQKPFDCEGESIERVVFKVKCDNQLKEFYYDEGACIVNSSKGFHTGNGTTTGAYYGNIDINYMIYLVCGCQ